MTDECAQYALILGQSLIRWTWASNIIKAAEIFKMEWWPEGAIVINLTELLRGL